MKNLNKPAAPVLGENKAPWDKDIDTAENRNKVMAALNHHIGKANAIGMPELL